MRFERPEDLDRELKAIGFFVDIYGLTFKKLDPNDIDFEIYNKAGELVAYVEVKGRLKNVSEAFPLPIACRKLVKLSDKRINPVIVWACHDGIIFGKIESLKGEARYGGRFKRTGSANDNEMMVYYPNKNLIIKKYDLL